ncbi:MAG: hypothetical protein ACJA1C_003306, partial [Crocinitomicaceae bacterium]
LNCSKAFDSKFANSSGVMLSVFKLKVTNCLLTQRTEFSLHPPSIDEESVNEYILQYQKIKLESAFEQKFLNKRIAIFRDWLEVLHAYPDMRFKFIDNRIMMRIFPLEGASEKRADEIREIIIEAIGGMRNDYSNDLFGMSYSALYSSYERSGRKEFATEMKTLNALVPMIVADIPNISPELEKHLKQLTVEPPPPVQAPPPPAIEVLEIEDEEKFSPM